MAQSNNQLLLLIKCWSKVKAFNQLQSPFNESVLQILDIIDTIYEKKMFIQRIAQKNSWRIWNVAVLISESLSTDADAYLGYVLYTNNWTGFYTNNNKKS